MSDAPRLPLSDQNLVWIDLEMTGLSPERDRIIRPIRHPLLMPALPRGQSLGYGVSGYSLCGVLRTCSRKRSAPKSPLKSRQTE